MRVFWTALLLAAYLPAPGVAWAQSSIDAEQQSQIRRSLVDYRGARNDTGRRVRAIRAIVDLGPAGVEAAGSFLENELERLGRAVASPPPTAVLDERIEELRKVLADLRADPNLSKLLRPIRIIADRQGTVCRFRLELHQKLDERSYRSGPRPHMIRMASSACIPATSRGSICGASLAFSSTKPHSHQQLIDRLAVTLLRQL